MITPYVPLVLRENLEKVGKPRHKKSVGNEIVSARLGQVGQKCRLLAVGPTCRRHVGDFPIPIPKKSSFKAGEMKICQNREYSARKKKEKHGRCVDKQAAA